MISLLEARAKQLDISVIYVSAIGFAGERRGDKLGGWDSRRQEIQVQSGLSSHEKVFVLAHEVMHAEWNFAKDEETSIKSEEEVESVVHCATQRCLEELGFGGYREFCLENGRTYRLIEELREESPNLAHVAEDLAAGLAFELNEALEASL